ncbi:soluble inorganic pyrophosphatase 1 [Histomonas meleagridis]|uniref:soluble inorganic pyrophosphatase 1 n=1 Tax=Histomonas meleagridis TaxID=135588 RepID=UPI00355A3369|nr:soluble inorganic pyrophosphatase 1 [Histomonas meleagridis]KAH0805264.1 soluble inorganic pyrophosphatase 1 [Histomonas meleagridis]
MIPSESDDNEYKMYLDMVFHKAESKRIPPKKISDRSLMMHHPWHNVPIGQACPKVVTCVVETPAESRLKTTVDNPTGLLKVDRILFSSLVFPANYGLIPETLTDSNGPLGIFILCQLSIPPLCIMKARPIGLMPMLNNGKKDDIIIGVCVTDPEYNIYFDISELPPHKMLQINQFFEDSQTLEHGNAKAFEMEGSNRAKKEIQRCNTAYREFFHV